MKNFMVLMCLAILTGCATTEKFIDPLCINDRPRLAPLSVEEQVAIRDLSQDLLFRIANNQTLLLDHINLIERLVAAHNEQFEAECW